jgi:hypothetical protein
MNTPITLTRAQALALGPCSKDRLPKMARGQSMTAAQALEAGVSIDDLLWVAGQLGRKDLCVRFALACAQRVAYLNPDPRVQAALDATQAWLDDPSEARRAAARDAAEAAAGAAAWAAGAAAWAARAAWAAAGAARAAWAAGAARAAGDAAGAAAGAAGDAARAAEQQAQRAIFVEIFG